MTASSWPWSDLSRHTELISRLEAVVRADDRWRWLEISCSLGSGRGDELSDIDAGIGYADGVVADRLTQLGHELLDEVGDVVDVLAHVLPGWPPEFRRFAVEFGNGVQLDLGIMPATRRTGLPTGAVAVVDKDGRLATPWQPPVEHPPAPEVAREWLLLGWWALSDVAKYARRGALFEAVERMAEARQQALRLRATADGVPFPSFGLISMLDFPPFEVPDELAATYALPTDRDAVLAAANVVADLLDDAAAGAAQALDAPVATSWAGIARSRLAAANGR